MAPLNISPPGGFYLEIALKYKVKQSKNDKFPSNYKASPLEFETQIPLHRKAPPKISPSKRTFEKYKSRGLYSEFYGTLLNHSRKVNVSLFGYCTLIPRPVTM